ncbi:BTB/POZ domain-containing protein 6-like [Oratosquilla oratoria]|uniref:BTB/POZ domain-containing protein 6-like n=1 Tax=Oratosquilla oratoria TaxID=337810 RepID=UPI003F76AF68
MSALTGQTPSPSPTHTPPPPTQQRAWQDNMGNSTKALSFLLATGMHSDVTLVVGREGKQFKAHRLILAMRSPVFEDIFFSSCSSYSSTSQTSGAQQPSTWVLPLKDDPPGAFHWLLHHIYSDKAEIESIDLALQVLSVSDKYMVAKAYDVCLKYLRNNTKRNNVLRLYQYQVLLFTDNDTLGQICREVFRDNGNAVLLSSALLELTPEVMHRLLQEPLRVTSEVVLFKALVSWGTAQLKMKHMTRSPGALREMISYFLKEIRFLTMSSDEFVQSVIPSDVLTPEESVYILKYLARPDQVHEPHPLDTSLQLNTTRLSRSHHITKDQMRTFVFEDPSKRDYRDPWYEFSLVPSDNIILLALKLQIRGGNETVQVEVRKEDPQSSPLVSCASHGANVSFKNPVHLREGVSYIFRINVTDPDVVLFGAKDISRTYETSGFEVKLKGGAFAHALVFT